MKFLDVNVLVYAHREDAARHPEYRAWLEGALAEPVAVSDQTLSGCLRVITHPRIFKKPTPLLKALDFIEDFRSRPTVTVLESGPRHWELFLGLCSKGEAVGNLIPDAYHAAFAMETGCTLVTCDRGFARFSGLRWMHPLD